MSRHTHVNLMEVEDSVNGRVEGLEGRFGRGSGQIVLDGEQAPVTWPG